jgi:hypothetical protein
MSKGYFLINLRGRTLVKTLTSGLMALALSFYGLTSASSNGISPEAAAVAAEADDAAVVTAQATADETDATELRTAADNAQTLADLTDAIDLRAAVVTAQATADETDATELRTAADNAQTLADLTDATELRAAVVTADRKSVV